MYSKRQYVLYIAAFPVNADSALQHREAYEEVGLPLSSPHVHDICLLEPFLSSSGVLATPVVALLSDPSTVLGKLVPAEAEVADIFDHPLEAMLDPSLAKHENLVPIGSEHWPNFR
jgi:coenzyme A diphosphatase NUDT7